MTPAQESYMAELDARSDADFLDGVCGQALATVDQQMCCSKAESESVDVEQMRLDKIVARLRALDGR